MKKIVFGLVLSLIYLGIFILIGEICFRVFRGAPNPLEDIVQKQSEYLFKPHSTKENKSSIEGEFEYSARINNHGYRGADFESPKPQHVLRIFAVGDSFTYGVGAQDYETIPALLQKHLRESFSESVEVINAGIGHASPITHYQNIKHIHLKHQPDVVVLFLDMTDLWDDWHTERSAIFDKNGEIKYFNPLFVNGKRDWWRTAVNISAFAKYIHNKVVRSYVKMKHLGGAKRYKQIKEEGKRAKAAIINSEDTPDNIVLEYDGLLFMRGQARKDLIEREWVRTAKYIAKIKTILAKQQIPLVLVMYPHGIYVGKNQWNEGRQTWGFEPNKKYTDYLPFELVEDFAQQMEIPFINTLGAFPEDPQKEYFFNWDGHLTPVGNKVVAQAVASSPIFIEELEKFFKAYVRR